MLVSLHDWIHFVEVSYTQAVPSPAQGLLESVMSVKRIPQLDGIRSVAVLAVFAHHACHVKGLWMGVDLFFILSGFLITGILSRNKVLLWQSYIGRFYKRRARRILPPYVLMLIVTTVFFGAAWMKYTYMYVLLMNFIKPLGLYMASEVTLGWTAAGLVVLAPILRGICTPMFKLEWAIYMLTPFRMDCLAVGALLALAWKYHRDKIERFGQWGLVGTAAGGGGLFVLGKVFHVSLYGNTVTGNVWSYECSLLACTGLMLWALSGRWVGVLKLAPMMYLGQISYTVYLIQGVVLLVLPRYMQGEGKIAIVALVITMAYASVSWFALEKPLLQLRAKPVMVGAAVVEKA